VRARCATIAAYWRSQFGGALDLGAHFLVSLSSTLSIGAIKAQLASELLELELELAAAAVGVGSGSVSSAMCGRALGRGTVAGDWLLLVFRMAGAAESSVRTARRELMEEGWMRLRCCCCWRWTERSSERGCGAASIDGATCALTARAPSPAGAQPDWELRQCCSAVWWLVGWMEGRIDR